MPAILEKCVKDVKAKGGASDPWAVCTASLKKAGKMADDVRTPEKDKEWDKRFRKANDLLAKAKAEQGKMKIGNPPTPAQLSAHAKQQSIIDQARREIKEAESYRSLPKSFCEAGRRHKHAELVHFNRQCQCHCDICQLEIAPTFRPLPTKFGEKEIMAALDDWRKHNRADIDLAQLHAKVGGSVKSFQSQLVALKKAGKIRLSIWSASLDRLPDKNLAIPEKAVTGIDSGHGTHYWFVHLPQNYAEKFGEGSSRLNGVEIFASGEFRGKPYTEEDLDDMVNNFRRFSAGKKVLLRVPAVLGHEETQELLERSDLPAAAWATDLYRAKKACPNCQGSGLTTDAEHKCPMCAGRGDVAVLKANFDDVPPKVARLLKGKAYRQVSAEVYDEPPEGLPSGTGKMLRRVAFPWRRNPASQVSRRHPGASRARRGRASSCRRAGLPRSRQAEASWSVCDLLGGQANGS